MKKKLLAVLQVILIWISFIALVPIFYIAFIITAPFVMISVIIFDEDDSLC